MNAESRRHQEMNLQNIPNDEDMVGLSHTERLEYVQSYPPNFEKYAKIDGVLLITTCTDLTYSQVIQHCGKDCRDAGLFQLFDKSNDDFDLTLKRLNPRAHEIPFIRAATGLPGSWLGLCPLQLCLVIIDIRFEDEYMQ